MASWNKSKNWIIIIFAGFVCFYYLTPQMPAYIVEIAFLLLAVLFKNKKFNHYPVLWYGLFFLYILLDAFLRDQKMVYVTSCLNVTLFILILSLLIESKEDANLFIKASAYSGALFSLFITIRFNYLLGIGRLGMELPGTRIDSAITLGYIFLYIMCMQIYSFLELANCKRIEKIFLIASFILTLYLTILTGTRKAMYLPLLYLLLLIFLKNKNSIRKVIIYISIIFVVAFVSFNYLVQNGTIDENNLARIQGSFAFLNDSYEVDASTVEREQLANRAAELFYQHPLFGNGIDKTLLWLTKHPHNNFLSTLSMGGIVMFMLYYLGYLMCFFNRVFNRREFISFFIIILIILPLSDVGTTSFNIIYFNILVALFMLLSVGNSQRSSGRARNM